MICPKCGNELTKGNKVWFCESDNCDYKQPIDQPAKLKLENDDLFYTDAFDSYYPLLAHEYHVLYGFMKERNYFGALLEYKDVVEIVLKFPTLAAINHLWRKDDYELKEEKSILELLLGKPLALGDWKAICELFIKKKKKKGLENYALAATLKPLLEAVNKFYEQGVIVRWRNETIGHGALQSNLESDSGFISEFKGRLEALKNHLLNSRAMYDQFEVLDASGRPLRGKDSEGHIGGTLRVRIGDAVYEQEPFILVKDQTTNIFDSFAKNSVYVLSYITGKKGPHGLADIFTEKRNKYISNERLEQLEQSASKLTDKAFNSEDIDSFSKMADEKELFTNPEYIINDIKSFLGNSNKGVLFLQMERGMGKTTLVRALDQLAMGNARLDNGQNSIAVRAYYINNMFSYRMEHFQNESVYILTNARNFGIERFTLSGISLNLIKAEDMAAELARFLNNMLDVYRQKTQTRRLLYIIDGLDEIRYDEKDKSTIFDCIPNSDILNEGVYVLLTGRHKNECAKWVHEKYALVEGKAVSTVRYSRSDEHNTSTLERYLAKQLYAKETAKLEAGELEVVKTVIEKGDHRFLYVKALRELLKDGSFDINEIRDGNVMERYLKVLERKYGKGKHYDKMKRLLLITALLDEPATIEELCYLYSFETADFKFIGYLTDLKGLLHIDRTGVGETISASVGAMHEDWKRYLIDGSKEMVHSIITDWINEITEKVRRYKNEDASVLENISDGESYLVANIYSLAEAFLPESKGFFSDESVMDFLSDFAIEIAGNKTIINVVRAEKIYTGIISEIDAQTEPLDEIKLVDFCMARSKYRKNLILFDSAIEDCNRCIDILERPLDEGKLTNEDDLAVIYNDRGDFYNSMVKYDKAIADYDKCIEILERLRGAGKLNEKNELSRAYMNRGIAYNSMVKYDKAMADYNRCVEILERLRNKGKLNDNEHLANAYMSRGNTYASMEDHDKAMAEYDKCIEILERLRIEGELNDENVLVKAYTNRGSTYNSMEKQGQAVVDYDKCIEIMERLRIGRKLYDKNTLATAYMNRGNAYNLMEKYDKAMADYDRSVNIMERLYGEGKLYDKNDLARAYMNRGSVYKSMEEYGKAITDYDRSVDIRERLYGEGKLYDEDTLAKTYFERSEVFYSIEEYEKAILDLDRCVDIREGLRNRGKLPDEIDLTGVYSTRGSVYTSIKEYNSAIADYDRCVEKLERLLGTGKLYDENYLVLAYMSRGETYYSMEEYEKAILDLDKCIEIREELRKKNELLDESDLADVYSARGFVYKTMEEYSRAIADYDRCVEITEELKDEENLAVAFMNRGLAYYSMEEYEKALLNYNRCIEIREGLYNIGKLFDENDLAEVNFYRGNTYYLLEEDSKAIADYDRCLEIMKQLQIADELYNEDVFAKAYENRKAALDAMQG
jgi:tetratricopeptide (TPR) repeat protein